MREYLSDKQVKSELTALLQVVHEFLVEHNIKYTITAGTLLGAVDIRALYLGMMTLILL